MQEDTKRKQFLLVDDDADCLATLTALLKQLSKGQWAIRTATNHSQALEQLKGEPVDAVVLDVEMPVMDGIEFLRLLARTHPGQQVVMLTGRIDENTRKTALDLGATLYLEKPTTTDGFQALYAALEALAGVSSKAGFRGVMQSVELQDLLQMECLNRKSSVLVVTTGDREGTIYISEGEIIHAQVGQLQGEMALYGLLALPGGQFKLQPFAEPQRRSISGQYQFLLMEAARLRDETGSQGGAKPGSMDREADFGAASGETATPTEARGVRIEEVLLSSSAGEVLYQWKCESIESRLELFKKIELHAVQASKGTPSGRFHRVSMDTGNSRVLIQIQPAFKLLVRSSLPVTPVVPA
ncbi:MAG TPA: response regulator [Candidatus Limnocylindrales bacterium]|jgi:DNA-binding response OmpR family regulator|nr:response regulator [Candidatus Limnocylindrales bacterium]